MTPMMMMMIRPVERVKAVKTWNQPEYADRGEPTTMSARTIRDKNAAGDYVYDKNGHVITDYDGLPDSDFAYGSYNSATGNCDIGAGQYAFTQVEIPYQDVCGYNFLFEDDVCFAYLGIETTRPSAANGGYTLYVKKWDKHGCYKNDYFATTYVPYKTYDGTNGGNYRIEEISEVDGVCTVTLTRTDTGAKETVTFNMLTDMDDVENRPTCQTGTVAAHKGTVNTTNNTTLWLAGHINKPLEQVIKIGSATSKAYDPAYVRTRWTDGRTWTCVNGATYWATCFKYSEYYYSIQYSENGEQLLDAVPIYDGLTRQGGFINQVNNKLIFAHPNSRRKLKPVYDDGFVIPEVSA